MSNQKKLVKDLISSFKNEPEKWVFMGLTAKHIESNVVLDIGENLATSLLFLCVDQPTKVNFSLLETIKVYKAMRECRAASISAAIEGAMSRREKCKGCNDPLYDNESCPNLACYGRPAPSLPELPEGYRAVDKALLIKLYNEGYKAGHHDTVDGQYTDIFEVDMDSYNEDDVDEIIKGAL